MASKNWQKIKLVKLAELLRQESDEQHPLTAGQIYEYMEKYDIPCNRRVVSRDVATLNELGFEILETKVGKKKGYYVENRGFSAPELKILIDAVQAASFITEEKTKELIGKLASLGGTHRAEIIKSNLVCFNTRKHSNEQIYYNVNALEHALRVGERRTSSMSEAHAMANYRVDRMESVEVVDEDISEKAVSLRRKVRRYTKQAIKMYGGPMERVTLEFDSKLITIGEHLDQSAKVNACVIFYGPNDLLNLVPDRIAEGKHLRPGEGQYPFEAREIYQDDFLSNPTEMLADASPINYITSEKKLPAFLFLQGDDDPIIPMAQGLRFCDRVRECGGRAEFVKIAGGGHGNGCWTQEAMTLVTQFLKHYN